MIRRNLNISNEKGLVQPSIKLTDSLDQMCLIRSLPAGTYQSFLCEKRLVAVCMALSMK